ncbi:hypothetical protein DEG02_007890 [Xanthomonas vasicola]|nr:hypothetical protein KWO_014170 [Xanthomonas vasicola pv. musacearum NCPPB 4379]RJL87959.1 hypothetical protein DEG03_001510 [Xanthomonas vasicola]RRJ44802.1 hypothetical protein EIM46_01205 [Xanthomonas vasicola pv. musacearum]RJL90010.1 hypothetical protein DEF98_000365 [Xanthomonas vasicola]RJL91819.1 hypothetical protein DEF95_003915 [Xanthomonas vasicola]
MPKAACTRSWRGCSSSINKSCLTLRYQRLALGAANKTTALIATRARPVFGIGPRHSYTAIPTRSPQPPDDRSLHVLATLRPSCLTGHAGRALPRNPM